MKRKKNQKEKKEWEPSETNVERIKKAQTIWQKSKATNCNYKFKCWNNTSIQHFNGHFPHLNERKEKRLGR